MLKYHRIWVAIGWLLTLLIVYLSLTPQPPAPLTFDNADKVEHALAYAVLCFWLCQIYPSLRFRLLLMTGLVGLGVALEYAQRWTGYRTFDVMDMLADGVGVLGGWLLAGTRLGRLLAYFERAHYLGNGND